MGCVLRILKVTRSFSVRERIGFDPVLWNSFLPLLRKKIKRYSPKVERSPPLDGRTRPFNRCLEMQMIVLFAGSENVIAKTPSERKRDVSRVVRDETLLSTVEVMRRRMRKVGRVEG